MYHREELERILIHRSLIFTIALLAATSVSADLLLTKDGGRVETKGPWKVQGRLVVFELPNGSLASMSLAEVDLEASEAATEAAERAARAPAEEPEAPPLEAVLVVTDDDVGHAEPEPGQKPTSAGETGFLPGSEAPLDESAEEEPLEPVGRLRVTSWDQTNDPSVDGLLVTGLLVNESDDAATNIELVVQIFDREREPQGSIPAVLTATTLLPGQTARFRAEAIGLYVISAIRFDVSSLGLETRDDTAEPEAADDGPEA